MFTKIILISLALAQVVRANPIVEDDLCLMKTKYDRFKPTEKHKELPAEIHVLIFAYFGIVSNAERYVKGAKAISEQLLKDPEIIASKSGKTFEFKQNLTKFEENYAKCDGRDALFELAEFYSNTTSFYFEDDQTTFDDEAKHVLAILRKYNSEELDRKFEEYFDLIVREFVTIFDKRKEDFGKELGKKLTDWFAQFKTLKGYDDRIMAFNEFFEFYDNK